MAGGQQDVMIPLEQATVPFYGRELVAVRLPDGRICAVLRWLCDGMQLDTQAQLRRIQRKTALRDDLLMVRVETEGGPQTMAALALHGLPGWLYTIDESRVASEAAREAVILFQREATDILFRYFAERPAQISQPATLVPSEPVTHPDQPSPDAPSIVWAEYYEQMAKWVRWQADIVAWQQGVEHWRGAVESRLESVEEVTRLVPEILERLGPQTLTPEHQATIKHQAARLHELSGRAYATIYGDLNTAFHVARYSDIADAHWPEIAAWFKARIDAAEKRERGRVCASPRRRLTRHSPAWQNGAHMTTRSCLRASAASTGFSLRVS